MKQFPISDETISYNWATVKSPIFTRLRPFPSKPSDRMGPWYLHLPKSTFWDLSKSRWIQKALKTVKSSASRSHPKVRAHICWRWSRQLVKFATLSSGRIHLGLSSSHQCQPLVLISTAQCITRLRRKRSFAKHSESRDLYRYIDHNITYESFKPLLLSRWNNLI